MLLDLTTRCLSLKTKKPDKIEPFHKCNFIVLRFFYYLCHRSFGVECWRWQRLVFHHRLWCEWSCYYIWPFTQLTGPGFVMIYLNLTFHTQCFSAGRYSFAIRNIIQYQYGHLTLAVSLSNQPKTESQAPISLHSPGKHWSFSMTALWQTVYMALSLFWYICLSIHFNWLVFGSNSCVWLR